MQTNEEPETEIPAVTITSLTENKIKEINIKKYAAKRVAKLFISDILNVEKVKKAETGDRQFIMGDMIFRSVYVKGTVVGIQTVHSKTKERILISVDDGTGVLDCYAEDNAVLENKRDAVEHHLLNSEELYRNYPNPTLRASLMMLRSAHDKMNKMHNPKHFKLGDAIQLVGNITEYNGKRSCFTSSILKDNNSNNIQYLETLLQLYETMSIK